jgi:hypothetical protein
MPFYMGLLREGPPALATERHFPSMGPEVPLEDVPPAEVPLFRSCQTRERYFSVTLLRPCINIEHGRAWQ